MNRVTMMAPRSTSTRMPEAVATPAKMRSPDEPVAIARRFAAAAGGWVSGVAARTFDTMGSVPVGK